MSKMFVSLKLQICVAVVALVFISSSSSFVKCENDVTVMQIFSDWTKKFQTIEIFSKFAKNFGEKEQPPFTTCLDHDRKLFKISDIDEFKFSGNVNPDEGPIL